VEFLRRSLPGAAKLDHRAMEFLAGACKEALFPRGHIFCTAGSINEPKHLYILKRGSVSLRIPLTQPRAPTVNVGPAPPAPNTRAEKAFGRTGQVGSLSEGAVAAHSSALFGLPEPYTIVANEQTTMCMISTEERPLSNWPREVVKKLYELLEARTDFHSQRVGNVAGARGGAFEVDQGRPQWSTASSVFLRHKALDHQKTRDIKRSVEVDDGWTRVAPPERGGLHRNSFGSRSVPASAAPPPLWPNDTPNLAGCTTPWGNWLPSGTLSLASTRRSSTLPKIPHSPNKSSTRPDERPHVDLMRPGDWRGLSATASNSSAEKMYWRQVRSMSSTR